MASNRPKAPTFKTPLITFRFPKLSEVDYGSKEFPKPDGEYALQGIMRAADAGTQALIQKLEPFYQQALANAETAFKALKAESRKKLGTVKANPMFTELLDQDTEEPTGELSFKFAVKASGEYKKGPKTGQHWDTRPPVFDKSGKLLIPGFTFRDRGDDEEMSSIHTKASPAIWGGSTGYVNFEVGIDRDGNPGYFIAGTGAAGLKLTLKAVQVIEVVSAGAKTADQYGFGNEAEDDDDASPDEMKPSVSSDDEDTADF
jgi:hypothetical protein